MAEKQGCRLVRIEDDGSETFIADIKPIDLEAMGINRMEWMTQAELDSIPERNEVGCVFDPVYVVDTKGEDWQVWFVKGVRYKRRAFVIPR